MPRKSKKKRANPTTTLTTLATRRHWIYAATSTKQDASNDYETYLHQRVQRVLVRSVPASYSYFDGDDGECCVDLMLFGI